METPLNITKGPACFTVMKGIGNVKPPTQAMLIIAGVSIEVCVALPAIHATAVGYDAYAVIDASGTFSETKRVTRLLRMVQAGVIVTDYATVAVEMLKDNASPKAGELYAALEMPFAGLVGQLAGAFAKNRA